MFDRSASFCLVFDKIGCCATSAELLEFNKTGVAGINVVLMISVLLVKFYK